MNPYPEIDGPWLITGASGLFGHAMVETLVRRGYSVVALRGIHPVNVPNVREFGLDITDERATREIIAASGAKVIVHAAGLTNVDECERNPKAAQRSHVEGTRNVVAAATDAGARLVYISTDHLWDGTQSFVTEETPPYPINEYARTKLEGERIALQAPMPTLSIRTNFFGNGRPWRKSFSDWILECLASGSALNMFTDAYFTPIALHHLTELLVDLVSRGETGILHVAGSERLSKYDFAVALAKAAGYPQSNIKRASVATYGLAAPRPRDMSLDTSRVARILGRSMPTTAEGIDALFEASSRSTLSRSEKING